MNKLILIVLLLPCFANACGEDEVPHKLQRLIKSGIVTVNYNTEEVSCDTKRVQPGMCEVIGEEFARYFHSTHHSTYKQFTNNGKHNH